MIEQSKLKRRDVIASLVLCLLVLAIYAQVYRFQFLVYDDTKYVSENPVIYNGLTWAGIKEVVLHGHVDLWYPLTSISYMAGCELYGLSPAGHHLTNLPLHAANAVLLFLVLRLLTGAFWPAWITAALFAAHPLNVEPVAWISGRKELLYTACWMLTVLAYAAYVRRRGTMRYLGMCGLFAAGLAAKFSQIVLPGALLLLDYWPLRRTEEGRERWPRLVVEKIPLVAAAGLIAAFNIWLMRGDVMRPLEAVPLAHRLMNAPVIYLWYLSKTFWPSNLTVHYPYPVAPFPWWLTLLGYAVLTTLTLAAVFVAPKRPYCAVGWLWFAGGLLPVAGLVRASSFLMADRYAYVPIVGLFIAVVWTLDAVSKDAPRVRRVLAAAAFLYIGAFAVRAALQTRYWENDLTVFGHAVAVTPDSPIAHNNLGLAYRRAGRTADAIKEFAASANLPGPFKVDPLMNLGTLLAEQGRRDDAAQHFITVIRHNPGYVPAHVFLGKVWVDQNQKDAAARQFAQALALEPSNSEARESLRALGGGEPDLAGAHDALGAQYYALGRYAEAMARYRASLQLEPNRADTHNHLGAALAASGAPEQAAAEFRAALDLEPDNPDAMSNLGIALAAQGRVDQAIAIFGTVLEKNPRHVNTQYYLAQCLAQRGRLDEAAAAYETLLRFQPEHTGARAELERLNAVLNRAGTQRQSAPAGGS